MTSTPTNPKIFTLPDEILTMIILNLHPREAILLSLTCRHLFHGVLSRHNSLLWYQVGGFDKGLPGWRQEWRQVANISLGPVDPIYHIEPIQPIQPRRGRPPKVKHQRRNPGIITQSQVIEFAKTYPPKPIITSDPNAKDPTTLPAITIDYNRLLRETMLGMTSSGCSWCLQNQERENIIKLPAWNLKLCAHCIVNNALPIGAITPDFPISISLATMPTQVIPAKFNWFECSTVPYQEKEYLAIWKPRVQTLLDDYIKSGKTLGSYAAIMIDRHFNLEVGVRFELAAKCRFAIRPRNHRCRVRTPQRIIFRTFRRGEDKIWV